MATFGLIHGAWHGAWCWEKVAPELERLGHGVFTVDLPCDDPSAGTKRYADVALDAFAACPIDMVIVGHSLGGLTAPIVASRRPASRLVLIAALLPDPGRSLIEQIPDNPGMFAPEMDQRWTTRADGRTQWSVDWAIRAFYHDCPQEDARWAAQRLRPQGPLPYVEETPLERWPDVPITYIACSKDQIIGTEWQRQAAIERLGVAPVVMRTAHSPFLAEPARLAKHLIKAAGS